MADFDEPAGNLKGNSEAAAASSQMTSAAMAAASEFFRQLVNIWHPHVYGSRPKSPTPFSIDDILNPRAANEAALGTPAGNPVRGLDITGALLAQQFMGAIQQQQQRAALGGLGLPGLPLGISSVLNRSLPEGTPPEVNNGGRDSIQSTTDDSGVCEDADQPQPLNLSTGSQHREFENGIKINHGKNL